MSNNNNLIQNNTTSKNIIFCFPGNYIIRDKIFRYFDDNKHYEQRSLYEYYKDNGLDICNIIVNLFGEMFDNACLREKTIKNYIDIIFFSVYQQIDSKKQPKIVVESLGPENPIWNLLKIELLDLMINI